MSRRRGIVQGDTSPVGEDKISELRAAFDFYGAQNDQLKKEDLHAIMQKLNLPVNRDMIQKMMSEGDLAGAGYIDFTGFMSMMSRRMQKSDNEATLMEAFEVFDPKNTGSIDSDQLYAVLTTMGDQRISPSEWDEAMAIADQKGQFHYPLLVKEIFGITSDQ